MLVEEGRKWLLLNLGQVMIFMRQSEGGGIIAPKYQDLVYMSENELYVDESKKYQGHHEEVCVMSFKNDTTIDLTLI